MVKNISPIVKEANWTVRFFVWSWRKTIKNRPVWFFSVMVLTKHLGLDQNLYGFQMTSKYGRLWKSRGPPESTWGAHNRSDQCDKQILRVENISPALQNISNQSSCLRIETLEIISRWKPVRESDRSNQCDKQILGT